MEEKRYTIDDVISSREERELKLSFRDGYLKFKVRALTQGEIALINRKAGYDNTALVEETLAIAVREVRQVNGTEKEYPLSVEIIRKLPPALVAQLNAEVLSLSGFNDSDFKKIRNL